MLCRWLCFLTLKTTSVFSRPESVPDFQSSRQNNRRCPTNSGSPWPRVFTRVSVSDNVNYTECKTDTVSAETNGPRDYRWWRQTQLVKTELTTTRTWHVTNYVSRTDFGPSVNVSSRYLLRTEVSVMSWIRQWLNVETKFTGILQRACLVVVVSKHAPKLCSQKQAS